MRKYICEGLAEYLAKELKPWHMPGHKRKNFIDDLTGEADINMAAFSALSHNEDEAKEWTDYIETVLQLVAAIDVTEVPGTDDLHHPEEMIYMSQAELAKVYGTQASYYMVNGSTGGILAAVGAVAGDGKKHIIIARNCHKSVYNASELFGLKPIYLEPEYLKLGDYTSVEEQQNYQDEFNSYIHGDIKPQQIKKLVETNKDVVAVVITSPTYEGVVSDVAGIKKVLRPYNIPLIVDEAHGAHLPFINELPESAVALGADIVVQSLHKTLPAMTQTAILHVNNSELKDSVNKYLSVFMSSSPSYVMLCSMELAVEHAWRMKNSKLGYGDYLDNLHSFRSQISNLKNIKLLGKTQNTAVTVACTEDLNIFAYDDTRIVLCSKLSGEMLASRLMELGNIEVEMSGTNYVVLISTYVDGFEDFEHLEKTIKQINQELEEGDNSKAQHNLVEVDDVSGKQLLISKEKLCKLVGTVARDNIYVYPPGSYIVAAGEEITIEAVEKIIQLKGSGKKIVGLEMD